jgi:hypothetical protein
LREASIASRVEEYYGAERQQSGEFKQYIGTRVAEFFNGLPNTTTYIGKRRGWRPMRSLRDTDREVTFRPARRAAPLFELLLKDRIRSGSGLDYMSGSDDSEQE